MHFDGKMCASRAVGKQQAAFGAIATQAAWAHLADVASILVCRYPLTRAKIRDAVEIRDGKSKQKERRPRIKFSPRYSEIRLAARQRFMHACNELT